MLEAHQPFVAALQRGQSRARARDWAGAVSALSEATRLQPHNLAARRALGVVLQAAGRPAEAIPLLSSVTTARPSDAGALTVLAQAQEAAHQPRAAAHTWTALARQAPQTADKWLLAATCWLRAGARAEGRAALEQALAIDPRRAGAQARLGALLLEQGERDAAEARFQAALRLNPAEVTARWGLARLHLRRGALPAAEAVLAPVAQAGALDAQGAAMWADIFRRQGRPAGALPVLESTLARTTEPSARSLLLNRLGELHDALGHHDAAFRAWAAGNAAQGHRYDPAVSRRALGALRAAYRPGRPLARARGADPLPVFIVGMPRSGTSLLEQMLDSHPQICGVGEREEIRDIAAALGSGGAYYQRLEALTPAVLDRFAAAHLQALRRMAPGAARVVDKMPHNFFHLGLIGQLFPGARVLHCVRDPVDTCFSCFRQRFGPGLGYSTRLDWLGAFYTEYRALMAHWGAVQPLPILEVSYEALVTQTEPVLRQVLDFIGAPWDPGCMQFHRNRRDVGTASFAQVQAPLYTSAIGRAAPYRRHLAPLIAALSPPAGPLRAR